MEQIIRVENLNVSFTGKEAVRGVSFTLYAGELLALVGESGSGKSVLCRALLDLLPKGARVSFDALERPAPAAMSLIMQEAMTALDPAMPVGKQIVEANRLCPPDPVELLTRVGIGQAELRARQYPGEFSGGMCQRAAIAVALAMRPKVIFADEPTTSLDADLRMKMMELFNSIRRDGTAVLFVTHDLSLVRSFADRVLIMKDGQILEQGRTAEIFAHPRTEYTKELIRCAAIGDPANHTHGKVHYHHQAMHSHEYIGAHHHDKEALSPNISSEKQYIEEREESGGKDYRDTDHARHMEVKGFCEQLPHYRSVTMDCDSLIEIKDSCEPPCHRLAATESATFIEVKESCQPPYHRPATTDHVPLIEVKALCKSYPSGDRQINRVFSDINLAIYPGEITGLCGPSGIGKSTLARCLAGLEKPTAGKRLAKAGLNIQMIFQDSVSALNPWMTVARLIAEPLFLRTGKRPAQDTLLDLMHKAELSEELLTRRPHELSGGQRQRVAIARAIAARPDLLIADEPVSSLDVTTRSRIIHLLKKLKDEYNLTMLLISHDVHLLAHVSDRIVRM